MPVFKTDSPPKQYRETRYNQRREKTEPPKMDTGPILIKAVFFFFFLYFILCSGFSPLIRPAEKVPGFMMECFRIDHPRLHFLHFGFEASDTFSHIPIVVSLSRCRCHAPSLARF